MNKAYIFSQKLTSPSLTNVRYKNMNIYDNKSVSIDSPKIYFHDVLLNIVDVHIFFYIFG
jgi:hypothetical protein